MFSHVGLKGHCSFELARLRLCSWLPFPRDGELLVPVGSAPSICREFWFPVAALPHLTRCPSSGFAGAQTSASPQLSVCCVFKVLHRQITLEIHKHKFSRARINIMYRKKKTKKDTAYLGEKKSLIKREIFVSFKNFQEIF